MVYQLVLQFAPWGDRSFDDLIALEDRLEAIGDLQADVDGHDLGANEANIFLFTTDPVRTVTHCLPAIGAEGLLPLLAAAFRKNGEEQYSRIWPAGDVTPLTVL
jgi:hypothetical protein